MVAPIVSGFDTASLLAAAAAEGRAVDLTGAVVHANGWENVVVETADGWILRFPRDDDLPFEREVAILDRLAGRLPVPIPAVAWTGSRTRFAAYRKLTGAAFDPDAFLAAPAGIRDAMTASLARFLAAMHTALTPAEVAELAIPTVDHRATLDQVAAGLGEIPARHRERVRALADGFAAAWVAGTVPGPRVPLHNDFHTFNMVFAPGGAVTELAGIWDFSCVRVGEPTYDLRYLDGGPRGLLDGVGLAYERLTGRPVDLAAAALANRMENVADALEMGRPELLDTAMRNWDRADAGRRARR